MRAVEAVYTARIEALDLRVENCHVLLEEAEVFTPPEDQPEWRSRVTEELDRPYPHAEASVALADTLMGESVIESDPPVGVMARATAWLKDVFTFGRNA